MSLTEPPQDPDHQVPATQRLYDSVVTALRGLTESVSAASARFSAWYTEHEEAIAETLQTITFVGVAATRPENWQELQASELLRLHKVAFADQLCLVWVPRVDTLRELLAQHDRDQRQLVLVARRTEILDDCEAALAITHKFEDRVHAEVTRLALKAIEAARDGHDEAAQALAGSVLGAVIHEMLGYETQSDARKDLQASYSEADLRLFMLRETVLFAATRRVLTTTRAGLTGFNRHATAHGQLNSFESSDMLEAVMLTTAWLREIAFQRAQMHLRDHPQLGWGTGREAVRSDIQQALPAGALRGPPSLHAKT